MTRTGLVCLFTILCGSCAAASDSHSRAVTVLLDYDEPVERVPHFALAKELRGILGDSQIDVSVLLRSQVEEGRQFDELLVFRMRGSCSMSGLPKGLPIGALSDERGALALTHAVNGETLSFGEVECDRVRTSVQRRFGRGNPAAYQNQYGVALARVMAHEVFHMLAHTPAHTHDGVTKAALTSQELTGVRLQISPDARERMMR